MVNNHQKHLVTTKTIILAILVHDQEEEKNP